jgi:hypothetical protein
VLEQRNPSGRVEVRVLQADGTRETGFISDAMAIAMADFIAKLSRADEVAVLTGDAVTAAAIERGAESCAADAETILAICDTARLNLTQRIPDTTAFIDALERQQLPKFTALLRAA